MIHKYIYTINHSKLGKSTHVPNDELLIKWLIEDLNYNYHSKISIKIEYNTDEEDQFQIYC